MLRKGQGWRIALFLTMCFRLDAALAAEEEIQVYLDDLSGVGQFGLDVHNNYVVSGSTAPEYPGARPPAKVYRLTPEFYYGLTPHLELGAYVLGALDADHTTHIDGEKLRLKYIAAHDETAGPFWGANVEVGRSELSVAPQPWNAQLKGIFGYRLGKWLVATNVNLDGALSNGDAVILSIDGKLSWQLTEKQQIGLEVYSDMGPLSEPGQLGQRSQMLYGVVDAEISDFDLNAGVGHALTGAADRWVLKAIVGHRF